MDAVLLFFVLAAATVRAPEGRSPLAAACIETDSAVACAALGNLLEAGSMRARFPEEPGLYFALACERGSREACARAETSSKRYPEYEHLDADVGCMLRDSAFACEELAIGLKEEGGESGEALGEARMRRALALHREACDDSRAENCLGAGRVLASGFGVPKDAHAALGYLGRGCALGLATACEQQAARSRGAEATRLYGKACELAPRSPHACLEFARAAEAARLPKAEVEVRYETACGLGSVDACATLSERRRDREGAPSPPSEDDALVRLGRALFDDTELSRPAGKACRSCHDPQAGFSDPDHARSTSAGAVDGRSGRRNAPTAAYARFAPPFHFDAKSGGYSGGQFWDGRGADLDDQASGPMLDPDEMNQPDAAAVMAIVETRPYAPLFREAFGDAALGGDPKHGLAEVTRAIAAFERSAALSPFRSKYDAFLRGEAKLSPAERRGLALFDDSKKGNCASCHPSRPRPDGTPPLFTDFGFDNLGIPAKPRASSGAKDLGLGGRLGIASENGKFKAPSLRNVARTAPYGHNGYFATLKEVVHFYNTRDVIRWPAPEVPETVNRKDLGKLRLTEQEEDDLVAFLGTLTDAPSRTNVRAGHASWDN